MAQSFYGLAGQPVKVGTTPFYAPFEYVEQSNPDKMMGSDIDDSIARIFAKYRLDLGLIISVEIRR